MEETKQEQVGVNLIEMAGQLVKELADVFVHLPEPLYKMVVLNLLASGKIVYGENWLTDEVAKTYIEHLAPALENVMNSEDAKASMKSNLTIMVFPLYNKKSGGVDVMLATSSLPEGTETISATTNELVN